MYLIWLIIKVALVIFFSNCLIILFFNFHINVCLTLPLICPCLNVLHLWYENFIRYIYVNIFYIQNNIISLTRIVISDCVGSQALQKPSLFWLPCCLPEPLQSALFPRAAPTAPLLTNTHSPGHRTLYFDPLGTNR